MPQSSVWRDQAAPEIHSEIIVPAAVPQQLKQQQPIIHEKPKQEPSPQHTTVEAAAPEVVPNSLQIDHLFWRFSFPLFFFLVEAPPSVRDRHHLGRNIHHPLRPNFPFFHCPFFLITPSG